jgi:hypothetical protein
MAQEDKTVKLLEQLLETVQNVFILQALNAGAAGPAIRRVLRVKNTRVASVSKMRPKKNRPKGNK